MFLFRVGEEQEKDSIREVKKLCEFRKKRIFSVMGIVAAIGVLSPFPFYYCLWNWPQSWVELCGRGRDPSHVMAHVAHFLKLVQFVSLFSVSSFHWPPPLYFWPLFAFGQFLNFRFPSLSSYSWLFFFWVCCNFLDLILGFIKLLPLFSYTNGAEMKHFFLTGLFI